MALQPASTELIQLFGAGIYKWFVKLILRDEIQALKYWGRFP